MNNKTRPDVHEIEDNTPTTCLRMYDECIAVEDDDDASEDELALCAICTQSNNK